VDLIKDVGYTQRNIKQVRDFIITIFVGQVECLSVLSRFGSVIEGFRPIRITVLDHFCYYFSRHLNLCHPDHCLHNLLPRDRKKRDHTHKLFVRKVKLTYLFKLHIEVVNL